MFASYQKTNALNLRKLARVSIANVICIVTCWPYFDRLAPISMRKLRPEVELVDSRVVLEILLRIFSVVVLVLVLAVE